MLSVDSILEPCRSCQILRVWSRSHSIISTNPAHSKHHLAPTQFKHHRGVKVKEHPPLRPLCTAKHDGGRYHGSDPLPAVGVVTIDRFVHHSLALECSQVSGFKLWPNGFKLSNSRNIDNVPADRATLGVTFLSCLSFVSFVVQSVSKRPKQTCSDAWNHAPLDHPTDELWNNSHMLYVGLDLDHRYLLHLPTLTRPSNRLGMIQLQEMGPVQRYSGKKHAIECPHLAHV